MRKMKTRVHKPRTERQKQRDKADDLWGEAVRLQAIKRTGHDGCEKCGRSKLQYKIDPHHVFGRKPPMRHVLNGGVYVCYICHRTEAHGSSITDQQIFHTWVKGYLKDFDILEAYSHKFVKSDYQMEIIKLTAYLKEG